jgi:hypothetical protein
MKTELTLLERRVRLAAAMVVIGLAGTLTSLLIFHPLSFVGFIVVGIMLMIVANFYFLLAIVRGGRARTVPVKAD